MECRDPAAREPLTCFMPSTGNASQRGALSRRPRLCAATSSSSSSSSSASHMQCEPEGLRAKRPRPHARKIEPLALNQKLSVKAGSDVAALAQPVPTRTALDHVLPAISDAAENMPRVMLNKKHAAHRQATKGAAETQSPPGIRQIRWGKISTKPHRNIVSFNLELKQLSEKAELGEMIKVLDNMRCLGLVPDEVTYATCLQCCRKLGALNEASLLFESMAQEEVEPDQYVYSIMIAIFGHASPPRVRESFALFEEMRNAGFRPNTVTCNVLLDACARGCEVLCALQVYGFMKENNVKFDEMTFCAMSRVYAGVHMFHEAEEMLKLMARSGLKPSIISYNMLLERMRKAGKSEAALELFERLCGDETPVSPTKSTAKQALKAASAIGSNSKKNAKAVRVLYERLCDLGLAPDHAEVMRWTGVSLSKSTGPPRAAMHATNRIPCGKRDGRSSLDNGTLDDGTHMLGR